MVAWLFASLNSSLYHTDLSLYTGTCVCPYTQVHVYVPNTVRNRDIGTLHVYVPIHRYMCMSIMVFLIVRIEGIEGTAKPLIGLLTLLDLPRLPITVRNRDIGAPATPATPPIGTHLEILICG